MNNTILELWRSGAYSEDEIVKAVKCSHLDFRQTLITNCLELPTPGRGLHFEIYSEYQAGNEQYDSLKEVAHIYGISMSAAYKYCNTAPAVRDRKEQDELIKAALINGYSVKEITAVFNASTNKVYSLRSTIKGIKGLKATRKGKLTDDDREAIQELLANGVEQNTIAEQFGVSPAMVSYLKPNRIAKPRGNVPDEEGWAQIKAELTRYTISEVARMHNISRACIYARLAKEKV